MMPLFNTFPDLAVKNNFLPWRRVALRITAILTVCLAAPHASAQASGTSNGAAASRLLPSRSLPILRATPSVLGASGIVTLSIPLDAFPVSQASVHLRVGLFEASRPVRAAFLERDFKRAGDVYQASFALDADPGAYEFRLLSENRPRVVLSQSASLLVAGVRRESGTWLLNGSPFVARNFFMAGPGDGATRNAVIAAPLFLSGLKRDFNAKAKKSGVSVRVTGETVEGQTLQLPALSAIIKSDPVAMRGTVSRLLSQAKAGGARDLLGFSLPVGDSTSALPAAEAQNAIVRLRAILNDVAPDAALILKAEIFFHPAQAARDIDSCAALCDAVVLSTFSYSNAWPIKVARRVAEEQPDYDLPIFLRIASQQFNAVQYDDDSGGLDISTESLDAWMNGLTGIARSENRRASWEPLVIRNAPLFIGSATYEDIGLLPAPDFQSGFDSAPQERLAQERGEIGLYEALRSAGRIPFLARLERKRKRDVSESLAIRLGETISNSTIERLRKAANGGARVYIEGAPFLDENGRPAAWRMSTLVGATAAPLPETTSPETTSADDAKRATMILQDGWMFGTARGTRIEVERRAVVSVLAPDAKREKKAERGMDKLLAPRIAARLEDGSPALVINPVGRGEVIWRPHRMVAPIASQDFQDFQGNAETQSPPNRAAPIDTQTSDKEAAALAAPDSTTNIEPSMAQSRFYAAIASYVQPPLVSLRGANGRLADIGDVRVAVRRSAKGTMLLALFNKGKRRVAVTAAVDGVAGVALDLATERELALEVRGFQSEVTTSIPAQGYALIALSDSRRALDEERNAPRLQARLR